MRAFHIPRFVGYTYVGIQPDTLPKNTTCETLFLLLGGEGQVEGERHSTQTKFESSPPVFGRPLPFVGRGT